MRAPTRYLGARVRTLSPVGRGADTTLATALERVTAPYGEHISWWSPDCFRTVALLCFCAGATEASSHGCGTWDAGMLPGRWRTTDPGAAPSGNRSFRARERQAVPLSSAAPRSATIIGCPEAYGSSVSPASPACCRSVSFGFAFGFAFGCVLGWAGVSGRRGGGGVPRRLPASGESARSHRRPACDRRGR